MGLCLKQKINLYTKRQFLSDHRLTVNATTLNINGDLINVSQVVRCHDIRTALSWRRHWRTVCAQLIRLFSNISSIHNLCLAESHRHTPCNWCMKL